MFDPVSRYRTTPTAVHRAPDGQAIPYVCRRLLPQPEAGTMAIEVRVGAADRLDLIAARRLGDPLAFWRIADANGAMNPFDLVEPGRVLIIPTLDPRRDGPR